MSGAPASPSQPRCTCWQCCPPAPPRHGARAPWLEFDQTHNPYRQAIIGAPFVLERGVVRVPEGPGLGIDVNREAVARFAVGT
jgi:D-galactarolactone cycloisomerase